MGTRRIKRRMFAVSLKGVGIISGTMGYSRKEAINHFYGGGPARGEWAEAKRSGYRTVEARVEVVTRSKPAP